MTNRLTRRPRDGWIAGVCAGLAEHLNVDPLLVRIGFIALLFVGVLPALILYVVLWIAVPEAY